MGGRSLADKRTSLTSHRGGSIAGPALAASAAYLLLSALVTAQLRAGCICLEVFGVDTLFVLDILSRVSAGETPHLDFVTPIGALPFLAVGRGGGPLPHDFIVMQAAYTAGVMALGTWLSLSRLGTLGTAVLLGAVAVLGSSLTSSADPGVTMALYYNRWAWIVALVLVVAVAVPPIRRVYPVTDGICVALLGLALLLTKITFFVAAGPLALLFLAARGAWRMLLTALIAFLLGIALIAALLGPSFWWAYLGDLVWVATNPIRLTPGVSPGAVLLTAEALALAVFALLVLRFRGIGTALAVCATGAAALFVQLQNFGAAPLWTIGVAAVALAWRERATADRAETLAWSGSAAVFAILSVLQLSPMVLGTLRNLDTSRSAAVVPMLPEVAWFDGLRVPGFHISPIVRSPRSDGQPVPLQPESCLVTDGYVGHLREVAETLAHVPGPVFVVDAQSPYWMVNGQPPLPGAAPWNYASLKGLQNATHIAVPTCAYKPSYQRALLRLLAEENLSLVPVHATEAATLYSFRLP